jgi:hypothetical protein
MGRQIAFRAYKEDLQHLENDFKERGAVFLAYRQAKNLKTRPTLDIRLNKDPIVWLARPVDYPLIQLESAPGQRHLFVDDLVSPVVELTRGGWTHDRVGAGRLHFNTSYFDQNGSKRELPADYVTWANGLLGLVRRRFRKDSTGFYVGPAATQFLATLGTARGSER